MWVFLLVIFVLLVIGAVTRPAFAVAAFVLPCVLGAAMGLIEMTAPARFLQWREADAGQGLGKDAFEVFDQALGIRRDESGFDQRSLQRTRRVGAVVFTVSALMAIGLVGAHQRGLFP